MNDEPKLGAIFEKGPDGPRMKPAYQKYLDGLRNQDFTRKPPSPWQPESGKINLAAIGKLGEEASELCKACFRIVIQGVDGNDPDNSKPNLQALQEEIADVLAMANICIDRFKMLREEIAARGKEKMAHKLAWFDLIKETGNDQA